jgi:PLD-like domain
VIFLPDHASALPFLVDEGMHGDRQAREALFCTFNADLGYFEQTVLGVTQSAGARVTIIADGRISDPDPRAARNAGIRYVHGLAVTASGAAFHPKVTVIAGPERALVITGSGNLSPGGWHLNKETLTVATADRDRCPAIVADVAAWLRTLGQVCIIAPPAMRGLERTASLLEQLADAADIADTGHRLVHNSSVPLIDQLPAGQVSHLLLYAPFHDEKATALRRLVERLQPARVTLAVQSGERTVIQPDAVRQVSADLGVPFDVIQDAEQRYRHGKLVEAAGADGSSWTLTGSPNLSARALLLSAADSGNIETGVISRPGTGLFPEGRPIALDDVPAVRITGPAAASPGVLLLAAVRTEHGLEVTFSGPLPEPASLLAGGPDEWTPAGTAPAGEASHLLAGVDLPGGTPLRCARGGVVFVTDPALVLIRPGETTHADSADPDALITDPPLLERWLHTLSELRLDTAGKGWLAYTDDAKAHLGAGMFRLALGESPGAAGALEPADKPVEDNRAGLDSDDETVVGDDTDPGVSAPLTGDTDEEDASGLKGRRELTQTERRRVRRNLETAVREIMPGLPAVHRLAIIALIMCAVQYGVWDGPLGDQGWLRVLSDALKQLDLNDIPPQLSGPAAAWAAVATYLMHEHRPTAGRPAELLLYEQSAARVSHLFPDADPHTVSGLAAPFTNKNGYPVDPDAVMDLIGMVVQDDPLAEAIEILEANRPAWQVHKHNDTLLHADGEFQGTFLPAAETLDAIPGTGTAGALATGSTAGWTLAIRDNDALIRIDKNPQGLVTWWHYRLSSLTSPTGIARDPDVGNRARIRHGALNRPFPEAFAAMTAVGADPTIDPPTACPPDGT